jgi:hypothetical protein
MIFRVQPECTLESALAALAALDRTRRSMVKLQLKAARERAEAKQVSRGGGQDGRSSPSSLAW